MWDQGVRINENELARCRESLQMRITQSTTTIP